ncbi:MAG TPA: polysaccharide biosynthesis protein, partial [Verrucomicrobia bacterium]|nr:polysaccharide biosynthesis protein [Verrucomicrobiota bacterium]
LVNELLAKKKLGLLPVALFDDDPSKKNSQIHGIPVVGSPDLIPQYQKKLGLTRAIIAMPSASAKRLGQIIKALQKADLRFETVPSLDQLATGRVKVSSIRPVGIQDLLGRESIELETESISKLIQGRVVLVSGAGGSIGSELCRQVSKFNPSQMIVLDQSEVQLFPIEQELAELGEGNSVIPLVCDVLDESRVKFIFDRFKPEIVFHAAAHKHVSLMEKQPGEAVKNNSRGTAGFADIAYQSGVDRFILISTDKAINPTSAMGASKRLAEMYLQALSNENGKHTKFMAVRFGNVLGSSGSVVPIFKKQIEKGGPVTVTHPDVTRFFMTIPEAVGLVLQSATQGNGGEIFVLDMGKSIKIVDLARQLIELSGFKPEEDIEIKFTGLRPGEKMYEEISHEAENMEETEHPKIMRFVCDAVSLEQITHQLNELKEIVDTAESNEIKLKMQEIIPEYKPYLAP